MLDIHGGNIASSSEVVCVNSQGLLGRCPVVEPCWAALVATRCYPIRGPGEKKSEAS